MFTLASLLALPVFLAQVASASIIPEAWAGTIGEVLKTGLVVFVIVEGLKNVPFFSGIFEAHPKVAAIANALISLLTALALCMAAPVAGSHVTFWPCVFLAVGTFLAAAGFHYGRRAVTDAIRASRSGEAAPRSGPAVR